jgi:hypothetical protein
MSLEEARKLHMRIKKIITTEVALTHALVVDRC